ncbi:MAG TPA: acetyl-CoA hydrolase/transferase C-terminal domain-containing protein [Deltaproteobacteria bacterium]|nr:acetyl-CoA hydrolase/transferase C-terminal domain-containing protein [Deltaproteobacteria bacterium]HQQ15176.1 acetyl-CoA hydrolase/transferase C-terminal domain-containing protein [Deltaproteobacteria bacterium]
MTMKNQSAYRHTDCREEYRSRLVRACDAVSHVRSFDRVVLGHACAEPKSLVEALLGRASELKGVEIVHMLPINSSRYCESLYRESFRHNSFFVGKSTRHAVNHGAADYTPCYFYQIPHLFRDGTLPVDVAMVMASPPDEQGRMSLGISVDYTRGAALAARTVIAEINPNMPDTGGSSYLSLDDVDWLVESDDPLMELPLPEAGPHDAAIGGNVASLIKDGDCLQIGFGSIPEAVVRELSGKKDLGIHSELITDSIMHLVESGVVTCRRKNFKPGKIIANLAMGTQRLYEWLHRHPMVEMHPVDFTNDPFVIARNDNMVTINSAIAVDLLGQVAADTIGPRQYSGVGGQVDFVRGAAHSRGGRNIIALPSATSDGKTSRIVCALERGSAVTTSRHDVDYIATEHGVVRLKGLSSRQRSRALIGIAGPAFRDQLEEQCRELYGW